MTQPAHIGRYEILDELGRGGFAVVYKARDTTLDRVVALKVLHAHVAGNQVFVQRFKREARTAARFDHPHIVTIHEVGEEAGQHYITMNFLPGRGLDERLAEAGGPLPLVQVVSIVSQMTDALDYIHRRGSVHRDVKPGNVMVSDEGHATLLDFGIVRAADGTPLTTFGDKMGTPQYMSPEQAEGKEIDHRSDIYALGVMTYQMCTGKAPFDDVSPLVVLRLHADKAPPLPQELNPDLPPQVAQVLLKALAKQPDERYQRAGDFAQALRDGLAAAEQARQREAQLAETYAQVEAAVAGEAWAAVEARCREILALAPDYRDVPELLERACQVQAEEKQREAQARRARERRLDRLYAQAQAALQRERWEEAQARCDDVEALAGADYRDVRDLRRQAEAGLQQAQAEQERQDRLARLYGRLQAADAAEDWPEALSLVGQIEAFGGEGYRDVPALKEKARRRLRRQQQPVPAWVWPVGGVAVVGLVLGFLWLAFGGGATPTPTITERPPVVATTVTPTPTPTIVTPSATPTKVTSTAMLSVGVTQTRLTDGMVMVYVPGGIFQMGSTSDEIDIALQLCDKYRDNCERSWFESESPVHEVTLDEFWLDQTEVTNAQFVAFLNEQGNQTEGGVTWLVLGGEYDLIEQSGGKFQPKDGYEDHPVIEVSWYGANAYCEWVGARLPTEAEWEYAARGPEGRIFPWGDTFDGQRLNFCDTNCSMDWKATEYDDGYETTAPVGSFPDGASWCDALDMAGNVWEWVADWYDEDYYDRSSSENPTGPTSGVRRVLRGGSWSGEPDDVRSAARNRDQPDDSLYNDGFRCAWGS